MRKKTSLLCRMGFHRWRPAVRPDNTSTRICRRCHRDEQSDPRLVTDDPHKFLNQPPLYPGEW
jgi:hypothetical protein